MSAAIRLGGALLLAFLILTVWVYGPVAGLHLLNHWASNVSQWWSAHNPGPAHSAVKPVPPR